MYDADDSWMTRVKWILFAGVALAVAANAENSPCYRGCDASYSTCYSGCSGRDDCRRRCQETRYGCVDGCVQRPSPIELEVIALTNRERANSGAPPVTWNPRLARAARGHAANMARQERMEHAMDGEGPGERVARRGYRGAWAENLAVGWGEGASPEAAVEWWMGSPAHRRNLLNPRLREMGVGVRVGADGRTYYCQEFGGGRAGVGVGGGRDLASYVRR